MSAYQTKLAHTRARENSMDEFAEFAHPSKHARARGPAVHGLADELHAREPAQAPAQARRVLPDAEGPGQLVAGDAGREEGAWFGHGRRTAAKR